MKQNMEHGKKRVATRSISFILALVFVFSIFLVSGIVSAKCPPPSSPFGCIPGDLYPFAGDKCHYDYKCKGNECYERCLICGLPVIGDITFSKWSSPQWEGGPVDQSKCCPSGQQCQGGKCVAPTPTPTPTPEPLPTPPYPKEEWEMWIPV